MYLLHGKYILYRFDVIVMTLVCTWRVLVDIDRPTLVTAWIFAAWLTVVNLRQEALMSLRQWRREEGQGGGIRPGRHFQGAAFQGQPKKLELNFSVSTPLRTTTVVLPLPPSYILQSDTAQLVWWGCKGYNGLILSSTTYRTPRLLTFQFHIFLGFSKSNGGRPGLLLYYVDSTWLTEPTH